MRNRLLDNWWNFFKKNLLYFSFGLNVILIFLVIIMSLFNCNVEQEKYFVLGDFKIDSMTRLEGLKWKSQYQFGDKNCLFLGDSITKRYDLDKYFPEYFVVNSGIDGNKTVDVLENMNSRVYVYNPSKVFLLIGTNQLENEDEDQIYEDIIQIVEEIQKNRQFASIYIESIYPVNHDFKNSPAKNKDNQKIQRINNRLQEYSLHHNVTFIDVYTSLVDQSGNLKKEYTEDGLHLTDEGYSQVTNILRKYVKEC